MLRDSMLQVGIGGLGVIGTAVARALDNGIAGLELCAVSARDRSKAGRAVAGFDPRPAVVALPELAQLADVVLESAVAEVYDDVARPAVEAGRILVTLSSGALLARPELIALAADTGARIIVPSGGIMGLDALKAAGEGDVHSVTLVTRKPPRSLAGAPYLIDNDIELDGLIEPLKVFDGSAGDATLGFPANANVAATLSLAGIGAQRTHVEIWADPDIDNNVQELRVRSTAAEFTLRLTSFPAPNNPRTGSLTPQSAIAALRSLHSSLVIGT